MRLPASIVRGRQDTGEETAHDGMRKESARRGVGDLYSGVHNGQNFIFRGVKFNFLTRGGYGRRGIDARSHPILCETTWRFEKKLDENI